MAMITNHRDEPSTDASLLQRARDGHEEGWQRLVQIYGPLVYRWMLGCGIQNADAADVAEDLGVSKWAVYKAKARVLHKLRQELLGLERR